VNVTEPGLDELIDRDQRAIACPYPIFAELRDTSPVHYSDKLGAWVCTGYDDIKAVLHDTELTDADWAIQAAGHPGRRHGQVVERPVHGGDL